MRVRGFGQTDVGQERENNEDRFLIAADIGLFVVCDGVGGHRGGERASAVAVEAVERVVREVEGEDLDHEALRRVAKGAVDAACRCVYDLAVEDTELSGMACTLTLLLVAGNKAVMAHVGDTRLYLFRDGAAWPLSSDHTVAAEMMRRGEITPESVPEHLFANALTRVIGAQPTVVAETLILDLLPDDLFLLCSDGLSTYFSGLGEVSALLEAGEPEELPARFVELANERGGRDNITVVVVQLTASDEEQLELHRIAEDVGSAIRALRAVKTFESLRFADLLRLFDVAELSEYEPGEVVLPHGGDVSGAYVPISGEFEVRTPSGEEVVLGAGEAVGLTSLLMPRRSHWTLTARVASKLLHVDGARFTELASRRPWLGVSALTSLAQSLGRELAASNQGIVDQLPAQSRSWWNVRSWFY